MAHHSPAAYGMPHPTASLSMGELWFQKILITLFLFSSSFVLIEPAPYDALFILIFPYFLYRSLKLARAFLPLILLEYLFLVGGIIGATQAYDISSAFTFMATTIYIVHTGFFFAALTYNDPVKWLPLMAKAYLASALVCSIIGIASFFHIMPGYEMFLKFDRISSTFKDPNVAGPYLIFPALFCLYNVYKQPVLRSLPYVLALGILTLCIVLIFSRAAWLAYIVACLIFTGLYFFTHYSSKLRLRILGLGAAVLILMIVAVFALLSIDSVRDMLTERASATQSYDTGKFGRFNRHILGFSMVVENPFGYGHGTFRRTFLEDPHNIYLYSFWNHGWLGGIAYVALILATLYRGTAILWRHSPWRHYLFMAYTVFIVHVVEGWIIDTHHWRHFYFALGLMWGFIALDYKMRRLR